MSTRKLGVPNWIIAIFTVLLAFVTGFLWIATRALVKGAEVTADRQLRAYVIANGGEFKIENGKFHSNIII
jgi:hypothetical protein